MRISSRSAVALAVAAFGAVALLGLPALAQGPRAPAQTDDPVEQARREVDEARAAATNAAALYQAALTEQARIQDEIARLEQEIPALRAQAAELRTNIQRRSAELYKGADPGSAFEAAGSGNEIDGARHAYLGQAATAYDVTLAEQLQATSDELEDAEAELRRHKTEQEEVARQLAADRQRIDLLLTESEVALFRLESLVAQGATVGEGGLVATGAGLCPVRGAVAFTNDWGQPRSGGRTHQGTDMFAAMGTPTVAVVGGTVNDASGGLGGISVELLGDDGVRYYYAHLSRIEGGPSRVEAGAVIGYVGDTGNALGGPPHLHFQLHPGGGEPVNPYPTVKVLCG